MVRDLWLGRNEILHQHQDDKDQTIYSMESAELQFYHSNPNLVPTSDQHYCRNITLNKLLKSRPSVRRRWLKRVKTARAAYLIDGQNQQLVTRYMIPLPSTQDSINTPRTQRLQRKPANGDTRTTHTNTAQQRMTKFFPVDPQTTHIQQPKILRPLKFIEIMPRLGTECDLGKVPTRGKPI